MNNNPDTENAIVSLQDETMANVFVVPEGTPAIADDAFADRADLTAITIPGSVKVIGRRAFANCAGLTTVVLSEGVTRIENNAFEGCTNLKSITIPDSIAWIGLMSFVGCRALTDIRGHLTLLSKFQNSLSMTPWGAASVQWEVDYLSDETVCITGARSIEPKMVIPKEISGHTVSRIGDRAFFDGEGITSVTVPETVKAIGASAFENCRNLNELILSQGLEQIGERAFAKCPLLSTLFIPDSVRAVGSDAVFLCTGLTQVSLSESLLNATPSETIKQFYQNKEAVLEVRVSTRSAEKYVSYQSVASSSGLKDRIQNGQKCRIETGDEKLNKKVNEILNYEKIIAALKQYAFIGGMVIAFLFFATLWINVFFIKDNTLLWVCWAGMVIFFIPYLIASRTQK